MSWLLHAGEHSEGGARWNVCKFQAGVYHPACPTACLGFFSSDEIITVLIGGGTGGYKYKEQEYDSRKFRDEVYPKIRREVMLQAFKQAKQNLEVLLGAENFTTYVMR